MLALDLQPRCWNCHKLLAVSVTRPWIIRCGRCKEQNTGDNQGMPRRTVLIEDRHATVDSEGIQNV